MADTSSKPLRMMVPEAVIAALPPLHTQDTLPDGEIRAYARLTCEERGLSWFVLDLHEDGDTFSGYWITHETEQFGYFSFDDIDDRLSEALAYDASFTPRLLLNAVKEERRIRRRLWERPGLRETDALAKPRGYYYAARYDKPSPQVFTTIRTLIFEERTDLSVYTLLFGCHWYVVVIGDWPAEHVHTRIMEALKAGTTTIIPYDVLLQLYARKLVADQKGGWSEGHRTTVLKRKEKRWKKKRPNR